ncbi:MAG: hypothetical protein ACR2LJ_02595 [Acidimicrobiales bacterium]
MTESAPAPLPPPSAPAADGLARPWDFDARYGDGLGLGVSLGVGGVFFVAWQVAYLHEMSTRGIDLAVAPGPTSTCSPGLEASWCSPSPTAAASHRA